MTPIRDLSHVQPGDVLYHPSLGFAVVDDVDEAGGGLALAWKDVDAEAPTRMPAATVIEEMRICVPGGFFDRSVRDPAGLGDLLTVDPARALLLLLDDLGEPQDADALRRWLVGRELLADHEFDRWWAAQRRELAGHRELQWSSGRVGKSAVIDPAGGPVAVFLSVGARQRFNLLGQLADAERDEALEIAIRRADVDAIVLLLRGRAALAANAMPGLRALVRGGEPRVAAALLGRGQPEILDDCALLAGLDEGRALLREAFDRMPRSRQLTALDALKARVAATGDEGARRFLASIPVLAMAQGRARRGHMEDPDPASDLPDRAFPSSDTTVGQPMASANVLLSQSGQLLPHRLLPMSIALARALAARHAAGQAGGLLGARMRPGGAIELGAPEDSTPVRDVRDAIRLVAELAIGRRPPASRLDDEHLLGHLALLVPGLPLDWMAVATRTLSPELERRPQDGLALWAALERALASDRVRASAPPRPNARLRVAHDTHIGLLKSRLGQVNQDAVFWYTDGPNGILIVADGISISTAGSGDLASSILLRVLVSLWEQHHDRLAHASVDDARAFLDAALGAANQAICQASRRMAGGDLSQHIPMGTTALVALVQGATLHLAALGDSRVFLATENGAALLTGDQNLRGDWLLSWQRGRPVDLMGDGHALTGYSGHFNEAHQSDPVPPVQRTVTLLPGEVLVMCSDGLTDYAADSMAGMAALLDEAARKKDLGEGCRSLVSQANARGGGDNVTVILARLEG